VVRDERQRHTSRTHRLPRRRTDLVEDGVAWLLTAVGLVVAVVAMAGGLRSYTEHMERFHVDTVQRTQVRAVLVDPAPLAMAVGATGRTVRAQEVPVAARYTAANGTERIVDVPVTGPLPAGTAVAVWVDRGGNLVPSPGDPLTILFNAIATAVAVLLGGVLGLVGIWVSVRWELARVNARAWTREWAQVEPRWSGRLP